MFLDDLRMIEIAKKLDHMHKLYTFFLIICLISCDEKLIEKPDDLIPEDKMVEVLKDLAIVNAAKLTNVTVLQDNGVDPMSYIFEKYDIDSLQFVESDNYYASLPRGEYERIYKKVESKLVQEVKVIEDAKTVKDSLARMESEKKEDTENVEKVTDSLP